MARRDPRAGRCDVELDVTTVLCQLGQTAFVETFEGSREIDRSRHGTTVFPWSRKGNTYQSVTPTGNNFTAGYERGPADCERGTTAPYVACVRIAITVSIATDNLMTYKGRFADSLV